MIENNINLKALDIVVCPLPILGLYLAINFDTTMKADHMYMTLEQSKQNIKTHHSARTIPKPWKISKHTWM
jgi:hypothetical protein